MKNEIIAYTDNEDYENVARIFNGFEQKYQPVLDEICKQIASKNEEYNLGVRRVEIAPYRTFMSKK